MNLENIISHAFSESVTGTRKGDKTAELKEIREYIRSSRIIVIPNHNNEKITAINEVLEDFGIARAIHLQVSTNTCDVTRMPALTKALMALDISDADLVIARGRLGVPGSGSMLVIMDCKGRVLSAALSPSHVLHGKALDQAVREEMKSALMRVGFYSRRGSESI